jgi:hypothetical protein
MDIGTEARRWARIAIRTAARAQWEDAPFKPEYSGEEDEEEDEDGEEGEMAPPPHSSQCEALHLHGDIFDRQAGVAINTCRPKRPQIETGPSTCPPPPPHLALVSPGLLGMSVMLALMKTTHPFGVSPVPPPLPAARVAMDMTAGLSSSGHGG